MRHILFPKVQGSSEGQMSCIHNHGGNKWIGLLCFLRPGDEELVREVLFDAVVTAPMEAYWTALVLNSSGYVPAGVQGSREGKSSGARHSLG